MPDYKSPGIYIKETSQYPTSVAEVETAIPAFIGYTQIGPAEPTKIRSMAEYRSIFGGPAAELPEFIIDSAGAISAVNDIRLTPVYTMYYALLLYFTNGGGSCYIVSAGNYDLGASSPVFKADLDATGALGRLEDKDEPTLIIFTDAQSITSGSTDYHNLYIEALSQASERGDRFVICDVLPADSSSADPVGDAASVFRNGIGINNLKYGAAYYPNLETSLTYQYSEDEIEVTVDGTPMVLRHSDAAIAEDSALKESSLFHAQDGIYGLKYLEIKRMIDGVRLVLPPSAAIAGVYAMVDATRGVWKAPANVSLNSVIAPTVAINHFEQEELNVSGDGKSINAIRQFLGQGVLVWGARTLDGNSNEWRYISVRRYFNMVEESTKKASQKFVFEPNDANTWSKVKAMIQNFLTQQWRKGALAGAKTDEAFFVNVGLGETMTQNDVQDGRMIIEIGMAVVRPAEFTILRFSHKMVESSPNQPNAIPEPVHPKPVLSRIVDFLKAFKKFR